MTQASRQWGIARCRRCSTRMACAGASRSPATACVTRRPVNANPVQSPCRPPVAFHRPQQKERRDDGSRREEGISASLLRPLDKERTCREEQPADEGDPVVEELPRQHDDEGARKHRAEDGREPHRPLRRARQLRPRLLDPVVERHVSVELVEVALLELLMCVRLVDPERRRSEPHQPERERNATHDEKIDGERPRAHARHEARPAADDRGSDVDRLAHHGSLSVVAHGCISGDPSPAQHALQGGARVHPFVAIPPGR